MNTNERVQKDLVEAMKAKDELRLSVLRMVKSALKNKEIEKIRPLEEAESIQVLQTLLKQRRESIEMFQKGGRNDLADKETKEIAILEQYLPAGASAEEMNRAITHHQLRPVIARSFAFDQARAAYDYLASAAHAGKVVIKR